MARTAVARGVMSGASGEKSREELLAQLNEALDGLSRLSTDSSAATDAVEAARRHLAKASSASDASGQLRV